MMKRITKIIAAGMMIASCTVAKAQDPHLSQWQVSPMLLNPAQTGVIEDADIRVSANYRSQWASVGSNISTLSLAYDRNLTDKPWSYGGYIVNNNLADIFNNTSFVGSVSYEITEPNNNKYHILTGVQLGLIYKRLDISRLTFDNQYNDGNFDPDLPSNETLNKQSRLLPETAIGGFYYNDNPEKTLLPWAGFGLKHLTQPNEAFLDGPKSSLPILWNVQAGATWIKNENLNIKPYAMYMAQSTATEMIGGIGFDYGFEDTEYRALLDLSYRVDDAVIVQAGFHMKDNWYRISYDIHVSPLRNYSGGRNAIEFSAIFVPKNGLFTVKNTPVSNEMK